MFRTELQIAEKYNLISHQDSIFSMGSCFAEAMGSKLENYKLSVLYNPFGTIFNPLAIFKLFRLIYTQKTIEKEGFTQNSEGIWHHYDFHSDLRATSQESLGEIIKTQIDAATRFLEKSNIVIITLGTAWVYKYLSNSQTVANCHKASREKFEKKLLSVEEICKQYELIAPFFESKKIILTVSPVRHIKDTLPLNAVSKSVLRLACHYLQERYDNIIYFPAYEIIHDDLRDYRFYTEDMLHVTPQAENYIWNKFVEAFMSQPTIRILKEWEHILKRIHHKAFNLQSPNHQKFLKQLLKDLEKMQDYFDVENEIKLVTKDII